MPFDQRGLSIPAGPGTTTETKPKLWPIYAALFLTVAAWVTSVMIWGLPGPYMPAVFAVSFIVAALVRFTLG